MRLISLLTLALCFCAHAADEPKTDNKTAEPSTWEKVKEGATDAAQGVAEQVEHAQTVLNATRAHREASQWTITGNYNFFEMWVLTKYGFTLGWNRSPASTYEFEYMRGSIGLGKFGTDIADITEQRMSLIWRSYNRRNSFNFITGIFYNEIEAGYGSDLLASVPGGYVEVLRIKILGVTWGLGNRWQTNGGFVWGVDWFAIHIPLIVLEEDAAFINSTTNPAYREDVEDAVNFFTRMPVLGALKVQLGFSW